VTATEKAEQADAAPIRREHIPLGILYMVGATVLFAGSSAAAKWLVASYSFAEVLFVRQAVSLLVCALIILPFAGPNVFRTSRLRGHVVRAVIQGSAQTCIIIALSMMPLASAMAINFSAPLFATLFSALFLREWVGKARGGALLVGFAGVLIITEPGADTFQVGALFAVANAVLYGSIATAVRGLSSTESPETLTMYQMVLLTVFFAPLLPLAGFMLPTAFDGVLLLLMGISNAIGQYWWTRAISLAPTSAVTPFYYFSLVWSMILGFLIWSDVPSVALLTGSAIVVGSGLFLLWRETGRRRAAAT
jgi:drug/metabolite transporter (DMT)-like permease